MKIEARLSDTDLVEEWSDDDGPETGTPATKNVKVEAR